MERSRSQHVLTVDVEDYFHSEDRVAEGWARHELRVERSTRTVLEACAETGARGTFFVLGWVAERLPGLVSEIAGAGHEVASHGYGHEFLYELTPRQLDTDLQRARALLEDQSGAAVPGYRAPYFSIRRDDRWAYDCIARAGHTYSSSVFPGSNPRYGIPGHVQEPTLVTSPSGARIQEIPVTTFHGRIGCGGVYFRALPYRWFAARLEALGRAGRRAVFYIHPWELDPGKPPAPGSLGLRLRHAVGVKGAASRLRRLLGEFAFMPMREHLGLQRALGPVEVGT
jgi:polysaccharide deacetylase family protein (PEP-CTERM system associated)